MNGNIKVFSGTSNQRLAEKICAELRTPLGDVYHHMFPSGEHYCQFKENLRGQDVFIVQSVCNPAHAKFMELVTMIDAARRASAGRITVVAPYLGYLRQDRKTKSRTPITAKLMANLLTEAGASRVVGLDFHCEQAQGFFDIPVDHLYALPIFSQYVEGANLDNVVISTADLGGLKRVRAFAKALKRPLAIVCKERTSDTEVEATEVIGDVAGCDVIVVDDLAESCGTILEAARILKLNGAKSVRAFVTHPLLNGIAYDRLASDRKLSELVVTDSVSEDTCGLPIKVISVAPMFARAIRCIHDNESVTELFQIQGF